MLLDVRPPVSARAVYGISVAAELSGVGVQTLRLYETCGLIVPERAGGGTRRFSADDIARVRRICGLLDAGLNPAGIGMVLELQDENRRLRAERDAMAVRVSGRRIVRAAAPAAAER